MSEFVPVSQLPVRLGVLGGARVLTKTLFEPLKQGFAGSEQFELSALATRDPERTRRLVQEHGFKRAASGYEELIADQRVDVVYVALPVALHAKWTMRALEAGKHVLCEKPFGLDSSEAEACVTKARAQKRLLMEGHHWRYHPLFEQFARSVRQCGVLSRVTARFDAPIAHPDIRLDPALGAGVFLDFGCYLVQWLQATAPGSALQVVRAEADEVAPGVDVSVRAELRVGSAEASISCDMRPEVGFQAWIEVEGEGGRLRWVNPLGIDGSELVVQGESERRYPAGGPTTFQAQLMALLAALETGEPPPTSGGSIVETQRLVDAVYLRAGLPARSLQARGGTMMAP